MCCPGISTHFVATSQRPPGIDLAMFTLTFPPERVERRHTSTHNQSTLQADDGEDKSNFCTTNRKTRCIAVGTTVAYAVGVRSGRRRPLAGTNGALP